MSGAFLYPPCDDASDASVLFIETSGSLPMCGHGTIGTVTAALEAGLIHPKTPGRLQLDVPAGKVRAEYEMLDGKVQWVRIFNVPSYLAYQGARLDIPGLGELVVDIAYGGNFYCIVEPQANFPGTHLWSAEQILRWSPLVREAAQRISCVHPDDPSVNGVSHVLWTGDARQPDSDAANAVFYGERAIDRSPCGTGTSARMAQLAARGELNVGDRFVHESYIGSQFVGRVEEVTQVGDKSAITPSIQGWARVFGHNAISIDDDDPYAFGFHVS